MSTPAVTPDPYAAYGGTVTAGGGADPYAAYGGKVATPAASDDRNFIQRGVDAMARYAGHPEDRGAGQPTAANRFSESVVHGALGPLAHPIDAAVGAAKSIMHPIDTVKGMVGSAINDPASFAGSMIGGIALGEAAGPIVGPAAEALKRGAGKAALLGKTPEAAYESALKPSTVLSPDARASVIKTGLQNEIPISKAGLEKLSDRIDTLNQAIKDEISADPNRPIDPNKVATRADAAKAKFEKQVNAGGDLQAIDTSKQQFLSEQGAQNGQPAPPMNASDAQAMKQGTYRVLSGKFGEQGSASVEAQKALARGLKEEIATQFPEISKLNATESRLLDLQPVLERAVNRISNHQALGIGTPVAGAAAKAVTGSGSAGVAASVLKGVLDNAEVKSRLAIAISKSARIPYGQAVQRVQAYSTAIGSSVAASQASSTADTADPTTTPQAAQ